VLAKVLLAEGSEESREQAGLLLTRLRGVLERTHSRRILIEVLALQGLLHAARGEESAATDLLARAVSLGQPGGLIRIFVDLGPELTELLNRVDADEEGLRYIGRILAAFRAEQRPKAAGAQRVQAEAPADRHPSGSPLTKRELEILGLLAKRLSNKEIARKLFISPGTVKRHSSTIYSKLGVHDRRKAVAKAVGLGILQ
jgi:LuxR family maltose regulon positive regulatory protein